MEVCGQCNLLRAGKPSAVKAATDAAEARWFALSEVPELAFDHTDILQTASERLHNKVRYQPVGFELQPTKFTLTQLQQLYEAILGVALDKRNLRKKTVHKYGPLAVLEETYQGGSYGPAQLFRFDPVK